MSDSQEKSQPIAETKGDAAPPAVLNLSPVAAAFADRGAEPTDDAPTIISKPARSGQLRPEDSFAGKLRGRKLAHFELIDPIGVGGMAAVIRALDTQLDRVVALKILPPEMATDPENIRRFQQEARAAAKLDHENIARVFFFGEDQGLHFIAFEFVEGENLRTVLEKRRHLPVAEAVHYMLQIATGLAHAAERGVVHRDIKPSNIIIGPTGRAKLVDMGLARSMAPVGNELTHSGVTLGTFDYISPEQALEPRQADVRSDIYSLGCTFYQMLTGQSPVPEGTAAKKLHHHQHVLPVDPRQLTAGIPDDLAAILSRMMAKDPQDRYQRPEHLVHHLLQVAQRLGAGDVPEGVLYVDAPLPNSPRMRPVLVAVASAFLLVMLVGLHGMTSGPVPNVSNNHALDKDTDKHAGADPVRPKSPDALTKTDDKEPAPPPQPKSEWVKHDARTAKDLSAFLDKRNPQSHVYLVNDIDLRHEPGDTSNRVPGLTFQGDKDRELTIQGKDPKKRPTIRLAYNADLRDGDLEGVPLWTALALKGGKVTLRDLRFEVDAKLAHRLIMAAVKLQEGCQLKIEKCEFVQYNPPSSGRLSDLLVEGSRGGAIKPIAIVNDCFFTGGQKTEFLAEPAQLGGQFACSVSGLASLQLSNCAFAPHQSVVYLRDKSTPPADVTLRNCSAFLIEGAAFQLDDGVSGRFTVQNSLFSRPDSVTDSNAVLIQQVGPGDVHFSGLHNRYHNLSAFWIKPQERQVSLAIANTWEEFQSVAKVSDEKSSPLSVSPWTDKSPLKSLEQNHPQQAFQADVKLAELRQGDANRMIGVERCVWGILYDKLPALDDKKPELMARKIVDPTQETGGGHYKSLGQALLDAKPGDLILVKHTGPLPVEPVRLDKASLDITLKPFPGYQPILTLGDTTDKHAAIFRIHDSKLRLEQLEFSLRPRRDGFESQAVIGMAGLGHCSFKNCVITLDPELADDVPMAVVSLADPRDVMKMDPAPSRELPEIRFDNCFVRGKGDLIAVRASRPFDLKADNCLVVLTGSFLNIDGNPKDPPATPSVQVALSKTTAYLTTHVVSFKNGKSVRELVALQMKASDCLFAASVSEQAFIHLAGEINEDQLRHFLTWTGGHNAYNGFKHMIEQQPRGDGMMLPPYGKDRWEMFSRERDGAFNQVKFTSPPLSDTMLVRSLPAQFKVKIDLDADPGYGAEIHRLPKPSSDSKAAVTTRPIEPDE